MRSVNGRARRVGERQLVGRRGVGGGRRAAAPSSASADERQFVAVEPQRRVRRARAGSGAATARRRRASRRGRAKCPYRRSRSGNRGRDSPPGERVVRPACACERPFEFDAEAPRRQARRDLRLRANGQAAREARPFAARRTARAPLVKIAGAAARRADAARRGPSSASTRRAIAGAGSTKSTGQGASAAKLLGQQRKMRAGEHDLVGAPPVALDEAGRDLARDLGVVDRLAAQPRARRARRAAREPTSVDLAVAGEVADQRRGCSRARPCPASPAPRSAASARRRAAGLIAGTVPTNGSSGCAARKRRQHQRRGGVAGDDDEIGPRAPHQLAEQPRRRARPARASRERAIGKERVVGGVDEFGVRPRLARSARARSGRRGRNRTPGRAGRIDAHEAQNTPTIAPRLSRAIAGAERLARRLGSPRPAKSPSAAAGDRSRAARRASRRRDARRRRDRRDEADQPRPGDRTPARPRAAGPSAAIDLAAASPARVGGRAPPASALPAARRRGSARRGRRRRRRRGSPAAPAPKSPPSSASRSRRPRGTAPACPTIVGALAVGSRSAVSASPGATISAVAVSVGGSASASASAARRRPAAGGAAGNGSKRIGDGERDRVERLGARLGIGEREAAQRSRRRRPALRRSGGRICCRPPRPATTKKASGFSAL